MLRSLLPWLPFLLFALALAPLAAVRRVALHGARWLLNGVALTGTATLALLANHPDWVPAPLHEWAEELAADLPPALPGLRWTLVGLGWAALLLTLLTGLDFACCLAEHRKFLQRLRRELDAQVAPARTKAAPSLPVSAPWHLSPDTVPPTEDTDSAPGVRRGLLRDFLS
jgi:hypothetical protein